MQATPLVKQVYIPTSDDRPFWTATASEMMRRMETTTQGLSADEAARRLRATSSDRLEQHRRTSDLFLLFSQFKSPIILLLIGAAILSLALGSHTDATIIITIILISGLLGFWHERGASDAVRKLLAVVQIKTRVRRNGYEIEVPMTDVAPGDIVLLSAGDIIPCDCLLLASRDLYVDEAALTGETYPAEKSVEVKPADTPLSKRTNCLFMGTHITNGMATALAVRVGKRTEFGGVSERLNVRPAETEFERGVRRFGYMLMEITLILVIAIFAVNVYLHRPVLDSFLFALALAVGLTPQLLPAIITVNLSHGARRMAQQKVIVKRLASIENFGSMDVLCSDKTGTLTTGKVHLHAALDADGEQSDRVLRDAYLNAILQAGYSNPIDAAIRAATQPDIANVRKLDEAPYDFMRKRLSILVEEQGCSRMITKGALKNVLEVCTQVQTANGLAPIDTYRESIERRYNQLSGEGYRTLGLAYRELGPDTVCDRNQEADMIFLGFLVLDDPLKPGIVNTIGRLRKLGVQLKIITGDNAPVAISVSKRAGFTAPRLLTGSALHDVSSDALPRLVKNVDVFAEIEPNQKERIVLALRKAGYVVGYMGDGINDAAALHAADVSLSVSEAVDVAKEAADIVLLEKDLGVLEQGVREGRVTFANTLKYVFMATSANFGNMFSMAGASLFLPFLPLLPTQVLLTNLMTDFPEMTIATDSVDEEMVNRPRRWDITFIRRFMAVFGLANSACDYLTFAVLLLLLHADAIRFRTGWFIENVVTAALIVLVIRTRKPFYRSRPGKLLILATTAVVAATLLLPITPLAAYLGFAPVPAVFLPVLALIMVFYITVAETAKRFFYRNENRNET